MFVQSMKYFRTNLLLAAALLWLAVPAAHAALPVAVPGKGEMPTLADMLERVNPAVVNIATYATVQSRNPLLDDPFFRRFFDLPRGRERVEQSLGSGVIVDAENGFVLIE